MAAPPVLDAELQGVPTGTLQLANFVSYKIFKGLDGVSK